MKGRPPIQRFCKYGHDKTQPHGMYLWRQHDGYIQRRCAVCFRAQRNAHYQRRKTEGRANL